MKGLLRVTIGRKELEKIPSIDTIIFNDGSTLKFKGLPVGIKIVGMDYDIMSDGLVMILEHPLFPKTPEGGFPHPVTYEEYTEAARTVTVKW